MSEAALVVGRPDKEFRLADLPDFRGMGSDQ